MKLLISTTTLALLSFNCAAHSETAEDKMTAEFMTKTIVDSFARPGGISKFNGHWATYYEEDDFGGPPFSALFYVGEGFHLLEVQCHEGSPVIFFPTDETQDGEGIFSGQARFGFREPQPKDFTGSYNKPDAFGQKNMVIKVEITWAEYEGMLFADGKMAFKLGSIVAKTSGGVGYLGKEFRDSCNVK
jgi:hypothetical protein